MDIEGGGRTRYDHLQQISIAYVLYLYQIERKKKISYLFLNIYIEGHCLKLSIFLLFLLLLLLNFLFSLQFLILQFHHTIRGYQQQTYPLAILILIPLSS